MAMLAKTVNPQGDLAHQIPELHALQASVELLRVEFDSLRAAVLLHDDLLRQELQRRDQMNMREFRAIDTKLELVLVLCERMAAR